MFADLLKKYKLSQQEIANSINKSQQLVSKWNKGSCEPQLKDITLLSDKYQIPTEEIIACFTKSSSN